MARYSAPEVDPLVPCADCEHDVPNSSRLSDALASTGEQFLREQRPRMTDPHLVGRAAEGLRHIRTLTAAS